MWVLLFVSRCNVYRGPPLFDSLGGVDGSHLEV
jgi:hypothetical protein